jgi:Leucine-rich repeat (LRR) protein
VLVLKTTHRTLTGAALVLALAPWMAVSIRADEAEDNAVAAIEKLNGRITRGQKAKGKPIVGVDLSGTKLTDAGLKHLAGLKQLQWLLLSFNKVTDAGLKHLAGLKQLQWLDLSHTKVTDGGLKHLAGLKQLQWLDLTNTQVTDQGKRKLKEPLPELLIFPPPEQ